MLPRSRAGFTLVEVLMALAVGALVVLAARVLIENLSSAAHRIRVAARRADAEANAESLLRSLVQQVETTGDETNTFSGDEREAQFSTWCTVPRGWQERCRVSLLARMADTVAELTAQIAGASPVVLRRATHTIELRYLVDARDGGTWFRRWGTGGTTPGAIGVLIESDTLILRIGERG